MKTIKRDYISIMPKPDGLMAAKNLEEAFEHYNEWNISIENDAEIDRSPSRNIMTSAANLTNGQLSNKRSLK